MVLVQLPNLKPWLLPIVVAVMVLVAGFGGYYYTLNRQTTHSLDVDLDNQNQKLYSLVQAEGRELVLVEGLITAIGLEQTENITFPDQYFVTVQNQQQPHAPLLGPVFQTVPHLLASHQPGFRPLPRHFSRSLASWRTVRGMETRGVWRGLETGHSRGAGSGGQRWGGTVWKSIPSG
jgi:hypothetical protein